VILAAADRLLARAGSSKTAGTTAASEKAQLLHDIAKQVAALTAMQERTAKRARIAVVLGIAAVALAAGAFVLVLLS
jgi:uncharacterized heparinase superfamily protein